MAMIKLYNWLNKLISSRRIAYLRNSFYELGDKVIIDFDSSIINPSGIEIGDNSKIYKGAILKSRKPEGLGIKIGKGVKVHEYTYLDDYGGEIHLDDFSGIGHHCVVGGHGGLYIGKFSMIAGLTYIVPANHNFNDVNIPFVNQGESKKGIHIGNNVWIGAGCTILDGVKIGDNSVVGAGSVVNKDIPSRTLWVGVPARKIKDL